MNNRFTIFGLIALFGFVAGIIAQVAATYLIPWLVHSFTMLAWFDKLHGCRICGAVLTVAIVGAWAYMTAAKKSPY